jgi:hypothetical protein
MRARWRREPYHSTRINPRPLLKILELRALGNFGPPICGLNGIVIGKQPAGILLGLRGNAIALSPPFYYYTRGYDTR